MDGYMRSTADDDAACDTCDDTGQVCEVCVEADGECTCEGGPTLAPCPDCN